MSAPSLRAEYAGSECQECCMYAITVAAPAADTLRFVQSLRAVNVVGRTARDAGSVIWQWKSRIQMPWVVAVLRCKALLPPGGQQGLSHLHCGYHGGAGVVHASAASFVRDNAISFQSAAILHMPASCASLVLMQNSFIAHSVIRTKKSKR